MGVDLRLIGVPPGVVEGAVEERFLHASTTGNLVFFAGLSTTSTHEQDVRDMRHASQTIMSHDIHMDATTHNHHPSWSPLYLFLHPFLTQRFTILLTLLTII